MAGSRAKRRPIEVRVGRETIGSLLVGAEALYVACTREDVVALDRVTLQERWRSSAQGDTLARLVDDDLLLVAGGREGPGVRRAGDGSIVWRHAARLGRARPWRENVIVFNADIEVLEARSGALLRSIPVPGGYLYPGPLGGETMVVVGHDVDVHAFNLGTAAKT